MELIFNIVQNFFAFILVLSILVFVHEYGHYLGCRLCKIKVDSFSIGMGKEICGWTDKHDVRWRISALPLGGYLKMFGDDDIASGRSSKEVMESLSEEDKEVTFYFQNIYKKFLVVFFGPLFNLLFAVLLLTIIVQTNGINNLKPTIDSIIMNSPAYNVDLHKNDIITEINGKKIYTFNEVANAIILNNLKPLSIKILRNNEEIIKTIQPEMLDSKDMFGNKIKIASIGIVSTSGSNEKVNIFQSFIEANKTVYKICKDTLVALGQIITGNRDTNSIGGPLKIAKYSAQSFHSGIMTVLYFVALISANLGLMNLLPIPMLDGGHLFFFMFEMIIGKPISERVQNSLLKFGFILLVCIMVFATVNDIRGFFN
jgi:regulator of sigma E protease